MNDKDGMHLGAGPFLLIYSRSLSEPLVSEWPSIIKVRADHQESLVSILTLITPVILRLEQELIHWGSWKNSPSPFRRRPTTLAHMSMWILVKFPHHRKRALVMQHLRRIKSHLSPIGVHHLRYTAGTPEQQICIAST